jgi:hypothetical protein
MTRAISVSGIITRFEIRTDRNCPDLMRRRVVKVDTPSLRDVSSTEANLSCTFCSDPPSVANVVDKGLSAR